MPSTHKTEAQAAIRQDALAMGFSAVGFVSAAGSPIDAEGLDAFIKAGFMGDMAWIAETRDRRIAPDAMWSEAKTAIVLSMNYGVERNPLKSLEEKDRANISIYARGRDYHDVIKGKLKQIAGRIHARERVEVKVFVDTAPLMEKPLAARAGLGWQGKHSNLVSRDYGSWLFLGVILTDADWAEPSQEIDHCGSCRRCLDICPTDAFVGPYRLDARRCISYLTIEHKGMIPFEFRQSIGNRVFGCDDCLAVCPWNRFATAAHEIKLQAQSQLVLPELTVMLALDDAGFRGYFSGTPLRRLGYARFMRNIIIAVGNSGNKDHIPRLKELYDGSDDVKDGSLIKASVIWALWRLLPACEFAEFRAIHHADANKTLEIVSDENDATILADEWDNYP